MIAREARPVAGVRCSARLGVGLPQTPLQPPDDLAPQGATETRGIPDTSTAVFAGREPDPRSIQGDVNVVERRDAPAAKAPRILEALDLSVEATASRAGAG